MARAANSLAACIPLPPAAKGYPRQLLNKILPDRIARSHYSERRLSLSLAGSGVFEVAGKDQDVAAHQRRYGKHDQVFHISSFVLIEISRERGGTWPPF